MCGVIEPGLAEHLAALDLLALGPAQQAAGVVARLPLVEVLVEHLHPGDHGLRGVVDADDLDLVAGVDDARLDPAGGDGAAAGDRHDVLDRHQERLVEVALGLGDVVVERSASSRIAFLASSSPSSAFSAEPLMIGVSSPGEVVLVEQVLDLLLDQLDQLLVVDHVDLVEEDDHVGHVHLAGEQDVLARLRHRAVGGRDHEDRAVHLRGAGDHVLDVVGVPGAVDVGVVALLGLVLDVRGGDRDPALLLLRSVVDLLERLLLGAALLGEHLGDRRGERGLAVVDVTDRADVHVRLAAIELLRHLVPLAPSVLLF